MCCVGRTATTDSRAVMEQTTLGEAQAPTQRPTSTPARETLGSASLKGREDKEAKQRGLGLLAASALLLALIHRSAWKGHSAKSICRILGKITQTPGLMDRMLPQ